MTVNREQIHTVNHYSRQLSKCIQDAMIKYGELSQSLDSTLPARLATNGEQSGNMSAEVLKADFDAIKQKRFQLENAGILAGEHSIPDMPDLSNVLESQLEFLAFYTGDARKKLNVFDDIYKKSASSRE